MSSRNRTTEGRMVESRDLAFLAIRRAAGELNIPRLRSASPRFVRDDIKKITKCQNDNISSLPQQRAPGRPGSLTGTGFRQLAVVYNAPVRIGRIACVVVVCCLSGLLMPGFVPPADAQQKGQPPVRVNILNVCAPAEAESKEIGAALEMVPLNPSFGPDYEVARGRSTLPDSGVSRWVRLRYEFPQSATFASAQYSFSVETGGITETLVVRVREPKNIVLVSIEDSVTAGGPAAVLATDTPADRVSIERSGKGSLVLARCPQGDQSAYDALFRRASALMKNYRSALGVRKIVGGDLERLQPQAHGNSQKGFSRPSR